MPHLEEDHLTLLYYGELTGKQTRDAREHLAGCATCRQRHDELLRLFALVESCPVPEPADGYESEVWRRLQPGLRVASSQPRLGLVSRLGAWLLPPSHRWAFAGAIAMVVLIAFTAGRFWPADRQPIAGPPETSARDGADLRERILMSALGDHFDRTQVVLVELSGTTPEGSVDISGEQRRAADLLAATRLYRGAAVEAGDSNIADILEALERMLVEITVSPSTMSAYELRSLQARIEQQELLFKLRVASSSLRHREYSTRPAASLGSAGA